MGILLKAAVDVGSTNSQVAVQLIDTETGKIVAGENLKKCLLTEEGRPDFRTLLLRREDVREERRGDIGWGGGDCLFGSKAWETAVSSFQDDAKLTCGFKQKLYLSGQGQKGADYEASCRAMKDYLHFLRSQVNSRYAIYQDKITECRTVVTVPNRSGSVEQETMKRLAEEAGWENVEIRLEAQQALRYVLARENSALMKAVEGIRSIDALYVLLMDIGGSTADLLLVKVKPDGNGGYTADTLGWWPERGEERTLGGGDVDRAVCDYMLKKGYLHPQAVGQEIRYKGYESFRKFKEFYTPALRSGKCIRILQDVGHLQQYPKNSRNAVWADVNYEELPDEEKINRAIYLNEIAGEYLAGLRDAVRSLVSGCRDGDRVIAEEDIDFVVATGGGSAMLGVEELIRGEAPQADPLRLTKLAADKNRYITEEQNYASAVCAMGCLAELRRIRCREHSNASYSLTLGIYSAPAGDTMGWDRSDGVPEIPASFLRLKWERFSFFEEGDVLPASRQVKKNYSIKLSNQSNLVLVMTLWRTKNGAATVEREWSTYTMRGPLKTVAAQLVSGRDTLLLRLEFDVAMSDQQFITIKPKLTTSGGGRWGLRNMKQEVRQ